MYAQQSLTCTVYTFWNWLEPWTGSHWNSQVYCILRIAVCFFSDIPHKPPHLCINSSPSTKSSLVGFYCFQGNPQSGGERISWREGNARLNTKKNKNCFTASSSHFNSMDLVPIDCLGAKQDLLTGYAALSHSGQFMDVSILSDSDLSCIALRQWYHCTRWWCLIWSFRSQLFCQTAF